MYSDLKNKIIILTGGSGFLGQQIVKAFTSTNSKIIILDIKKPKNNKVNFYKCNITKEEEVIAVSKKILKKFKKIDVLINNAGNAHGLDFAHKANILDWEEMINTNIKGVLYVTKAILNDMVKRKSGQIINVGSIAGKESYPKGNVYCASKAAIDRFTEGLRLDLNPYGIRVSAIHPGLVETNFSNVRFKGDEIKAKKVYQGFKPLSPDDVADCIYYMINTPKHVNIADCTILPTDQAGAYVLNKSN